MTGHAPPSTGQMTELHDLALMSKKSLGRAVNFTALLAVPASDT